MKLYRFFVFAFLISVLNACTTTKVLQATGGSKSDGIVELSFEYGIFEKPQVNWQNGIVTAKQKCAAWGFNGADPFGGAISQCQAYNGYGNCVSFFVTMKYQCTSF